MPNPVIAATATLGIAASASLAFIVVYYTRRRSPQERERRRRIHLHVNGRLTEATIYQADASLIQYGYQIAGVAYDTNQEISALEAYLPCPAEQLIGTALAKYDPQNPANSMVISEHWLGFKER